MKTSTEKCPEKELLLRKGIQKTKVKFHEK